MPTVDVRKALCDVFVDIVWIIRPSETKFCFIACTRGDPIWDHPIATNIFAIFVDLPELNLAHFFALETRVVEIFEARDGLEH